MRWGQFPQGRHSLREIVCTLGRGHGTFDADPICPTQLIS